jgi:formamidopyrimidine-DNA glycosylase
MPELPEVESIRRGLVRARLQAPIVAVWRSAFALRIGATWRDEGLHRLRGRTPATVRRRGKHLVIELDRDVGLLVHLGMTGRVLVLPRETEPELHTHLRLTFADDRELRFVDPRRFGGLRAAPLDELATSPPLSELGPEPLARRFDGRVLAERGGHSRRSLHEVLLDQRVVAGVGNIYAQEALYRARLDPRVPAQRLTLEAWERVAAHVRDVLRESIAHGGTTFRDYRDADGGMGRNQERLAVYGRAGQACPSCGATLVAYDIGGRRGARCPVEQRPTRGRIR